MLHYYCNTGWVMDTCVHFNMYITNIVVTSFCVQLLLIYLALYAIFIHLHTLLGVSIVAK